MNGGELALILIGIAANIAVIVTAIVVYQSFNRTIHAAELRRVRVHEKITQWTDPGFAAMLGVHRDFLEDDNVSSIDRVSKFENDPDFRLTIIQITNFLEGLAQGIFEGVLDEESARRYFRYIVVNSYKYLEPIMVSRRSPTTTSAGHPDLGIEFEKLAKQWT